MDKYEIESKLLARAIDLAIETWEKHPDSDVEGQLIAVREMKEWKQMCLFPERNYRNLTSLKYLKQNLLSVFYNDHGDRAIFFWKRLKEEGINYEGKDLLKKIFKRKKIANRFEYEYAQDNIGFARQDGRITKEEALLLGKWIGEFENRNAEL